MADQVRQQTKGKRPGKTSGHNSDAGRNRGQVSDPRQVSSMVSDVVRSTGKALSHEQSVWATSTFGQDFSGVRIHTDPQAADSARALQAAAYTVGQDVVFGEGRFQPTNLAGQRLLAHELAHVLQQRGKESQATGPLRLSNRGDRSEQDAARIADSAVGGTLAPGLEESAPVSPMLVQRQEEEPAGEQTVDEQTDSGQETAVPASSTEEQGWTLADPTVNFDISHQNAREASFRMVGGSAGTGPGFSDWSNPRVFTISPGEHTWLHLAFWSDRKERPIPAEYRDVTSVFTDIKFTPADGSTPVDKHFSDDTPQYQAPGQSLLPKLGFTAPSARDLPVIDLPLNGGGELVWRAGFRFGGGGVTYEANGSFTLRVETPESGVTPGVEAPANESGASPSKGTPLPGSPSAQSAPPAAVREIQALTEAIKATAEAIKKDELVKALRKAVVKVQPFLPSKDAEKIINEAIDSLVKSGVDKGIMAILEAVAGKPGSTMPENPSQVGPMLPQKDLDEHLFTGPKIPIPDTPAPRPKYTFHYKNGLRKSYSPGEKMKFTVVPPDNFSSLRGGKRLVIVRESERDAANAERLGRVSLESASPVVVDLQAPLKPGKYVLRVDIGLSFDYSSAEEFEVSSPTSK